MDTTPQDVYNTKFLYLLENMPADLESKEAATWMQNLKTFSECKLPEPTPAIEIEPEPVVPTTRWGKIRDGLGRALDNETTRTLIKAGGSFAGVAVVVYSTIHRDHVLERASLQQANQHNS